jgi:drug/metabolite transporter (DMT)-like permease
MPDPIGPYMKHLSTTKKAFLAIIIANIIWGAAAPIFKLSLTNIPPFTLAFWRFFLGAIILLIYLRGKAAFEFSTTREFLDLIAYSVTGITINILFFFWGLERTFSINSPVIGSAAPILTFFLALAFLGERFSIRKFVGMSLGTLGILAIVFEPLLRKGVDGSTLGNLFLVIATVAAVLQTIIGKRALHDVNPVTFTFWSFVIGAASFLPLAFYEYSTNTALYHTLDWRAVMGVSYGAIFSSAVAYTLFAWGLSKITATDASLFTYLDPVVGTILGVILLKEPLTSYFLLGALFIFGGIFIAEGRLNYHPFLRFRLLDLPVKIPTVAPKPYHSDKSKTEILKNIFTRPS